MQAEKIKLFSVKPPPNSEQRQLLLFAISLTAQSVQAA
jgi:hypothetical protein